MIDVVQYLLPVFFHLKFAKFVVNNLHLSVVENDSVGAGDGTVGEQDFRFGFYLYVRRKPAADDRIFERTTHHARSMDSPTENRVETVETTSEWSSEVINRGEVMTLATLVCAIKSIMRMSGRITVTAKNAARSSLKINGLLLLTRGPPLLNNAGAHCASPTI